MTDPTKIAVTVLGSTGSVGRNTLKVIENNSDLYSVYGLSAHRDVEAMLSQCERLIPAVAVMADATAADDLATRLRARQIPTRVAGGTDALCDLASDAASPVVMAAIVGAAGLPSLVKAVIAGKRVLIANKEPLVMMGSSIVAKAVKFGAQLLPIDSEHNAIFQCLYPAHSSVDIADKRPALGDVSVAGIRRILLTGSGGPFRTLSSDAFSAVTAEQAVRHPNWSMGKKISVDSSTLMNKGLELIEAIHLFSMPEDRIDIVIHPQSVVHSMVEYQDGSVMASLASPDMRVPIAHALAWPQRIKSGSPRLDFTQMSSLDFEAPDPERFPCLRLAREAARLGGRAPTVLNAANEIAVEAFLEEKIGFMDIPAVVESTLDHTINRFKSFNTVESLGDDLEAILADDAEARRIAEKAVQDRWTKRSISVS